MPFDHSLAIIAGEAQGDRAAVILSSSKDKADRKIPKSMAFTYILKCADGSYYTGVTNDIQRRLGEHQPGLVPGYTSQRGPVTLAWCSDDVDIASAIHTEKRIKGWLRVKKVELIEAENPNWEDLSAVWFEAE